MFFKVLEIYKKLRDDNKKDIPFNIKVLIGLVTIDFILLFVCEINNCNVGVIITYCISVATRVIQLAYLQLIAPVPILSYISDPEGSFKNWTKQCMTTYLDLFIRLAVVYFAIFLIMDIISEGIVINIGFTENPLLNHSGS